MSRSLIASLSMCFQQRAKINIVQSFSNFVSDGEFGWFSHYKDVSWKGRIYIVTFEGDQRERINKKEIITEIDMIDIDIEMIDIDIEPSNS